MIATVPEHGSLAEHGIDVRGQIYWHPTTSQLYAVSYTHLTLPTTPYV